MTQTRGCGRATKKDLSQEQEQQSKVRGRGRGRGRDRERGSESGSGSGSGKIASPNKKTHLLNEVLEDSDYDKDPIESSLFPENTALSSRNTHVLEELNDISAPTRKVSRLQDYRNLDDRRVVSRDPSALLPLRQIHGNSNELDDISASRQRESNALLPLHQVSGNSTELNNMSPRVIPKNPDTSVRQVHNVSPGRAIPRNLTTTVHQVRGNSNELDDISASRQRESNALLPLHQVSGSSTELNNMSLRVIPKNPDTSVRQVHNVSPGRAIPRNLTTTVYQVRGNSTEFDDISASRRRESNTLLPLHQVRGNSTELDNVSSGRVIPRNSDTTVRQVQGNSIDLDNITAPLRTVPRNSDTSASTRPSNTPAATLPPCFNDMEMIFQLSNWLCANPNVLQFANVMYSSIQSSLVNGQLSMPSILNTTTLQSQSTFQEDKSKDSHNYLEELKCLFLRTRNSPKHAFEELVRQIMKCELNSAEGLEWLKIGNRNFGNFRNKFLDGIERLVNLIEEQRSRYGIHTTTLPQQEDVDDFVDEETTMDVLKRWLSAVFFIEYFIIIVK